MAKVGFWVVWGLPAQGRERQALESIREATRELETLQQEGRIEHFDMVVLMPQNIEFGGFCLISGSREQIDSLRNDDEFQKWVFRLQMVSDKFGVMDAWVDKGVPIALRLYDEAIRRVLGPVATQPVEEASSPGVLPSYEQLQAQMYPPDSAPSR